MSENQADEFMRKLQILLILGGVLILAPLLFLGFLVDRRVHSLEQQLHYAPPLGDSEPVMEEEMDITPWESVQGQLVYVPAYSHVYHQDGKPHLLTVTLSVRNTDLENPIVVNSVRYYDTAGKEVKSFINRPKTIGPLSTIEFLVARDDRDGGSGANFLVEWNSAKMVTEPILEAVMIDTTSQQGISFVRTGKVIKALSGSQQPPAPPASQP